MAENIGHKIDVTGLFVERSSIGASQLVRRDLLIRGNFTGIFFYHIFNRLYAHPFSLCGEEQGILMAWERDRIFPRCIEISFQRVFDFFAKIHDHFIPAFPSDLDPVVLEIHVLDIQADAFRNTDSGPEKESEDRQISVLCLFVICLSLTGQVIAAVIYIVQQHCNLIRIQTYDRLVMEFWHVHQQSRIL